MNAGEWKRGSLAGAAYTQRASASPVPQHTLNEACVNEATSLRAAYVIPNEYIFSRAPARALLLHAM
jgi:hypothetical protein